MTDRAFVRVGCAAAVVLVLALSVVSAITLAVQS